jgi:capsular exopolysaccharide synthesis family protein
VSVTVPTQSDVLQISYRDPVKKVAQGGAQAFALAYVHSKIVKAQELLDQLRAPLVKTQGTLQKKLTKLNTQLDAAITSNAGNKLTAAGTEKVQNLTTQRNSVQDQLDSLSQQLLGLDPSHVNPPQVLVPAKLPTKPVLPNKVLDGALGLFAGLALGIGFAFLRERLDDRLRGRADVEELLRAPVLAVVPRVPGWRRQTESRLVMLDDPTGAAAEAYRKVRTSLLFAAAQRPMKSVLVCSATAGEGKSTTAANIAVALSQANKRVIALSADLRKPRLHRFFNLDSGPGLTDMLLHGVPAWEGLPGPNVPNLRVIASSSVPSGPTELLQSERMQEVLEQLEATADIVVIDTTPLLAVSDALILASLVDAVLLVVDSEDSSKGAVRHAREELDDVAAPVIGAVLNKYDPSKAGDRYYYGYYYDAMYSRGVPAEQRAAAGPNGQLAPGPVAERVPPPADRPSS